MIARNILLTGRPVIGKTTVIVRLPEALPDCDIGGIHCGSQVPARRSGMRADQGNQERDAGGTRRRGGQNMAIVGALVAV